MRESLSALRSSGVGVGLAHEIRLLLCFLVMTSWGLSADNYGSYRSSPSGGKKDVAKKPGEKTLTIPGIVIARKADQGFLGLELVDFKYKLTFYDSEKKATPADYSRALFRWSKINGSGSERYMLSTGSESSVLTLPRNVKPPHNFRLFIVLLDDDPETEAETYVVMFRP